MDQGRNKPPKAQGPGGGEDHAGTPDATPPAGLAISVARASPQTFPLLACTRADKRRGGVRDGTQSAEDSEGFRTPKAVWVRWVGRGGWVGEWEGAEEEGEVERMGNGGGRAKPLSGFQVLGFPLDPALFLVCYLGGIARVFRQILLFLWLLLQVGLSLKIHSKT